MEPRDYSRCVPHSPASMPKALQAFQIPQAAPSWEPISQNFADPVEHLPTNSIIHSPSFTFLVGPKHTKLTIQSGLAQHVSKPLHNLMNNGHTRESKHRIAVLEDEDVETFVAFCEYAYTGDYKVPQLPVPVPGLAAVPVSREDIRTGVVETASISGRVTYRSDSVSSAVPPPAPSPPPESETDSQTVRPEGQVPSVISQDVAAEREAKVEADADPGEADGGAGDAAEPGGQEDIQIEEAQPSTEAHENIESPGEIDWPQGRSSEDSPAEPGEQIAPEAAEPADEGTSWEATSAYPSHTKKGKKTKGKRGKKKSQPLPLEDEPPASLTPPSTPPPQEPEIVEVEPEPVPEEAEPLEPEVCETEPTACEEALKELEEAESPVEERTAPAMRSPMRSPSAAPEEASEWPQSSGYPPQEENKEDQDDDTPDSPTMHTASSPKPIIDMSFAKQQSDSTPRTPGLSLWDEFAALQYNDDRPPTTSTSTSKSAPATNTDLPYLTFHAKVYVFATRYLIPALAQLCLRKLHTDLLHLPLGDDNSEVSSNAEEADADADAEAGAQPPTRPGLPGAPAIVLDVLRYAYTKTTRLEPINPTSATQLRENELRRLVVHYAACRVKELARWHGGGSGSATPAGRGLGVDGTKPTSLRALLDTTPELASDLVYRMM